MVERKTPPHIFEHDLDAVIGELGKDRLIFVKNLPPKAKQAKRMKNLVQKASVSTYTTFRTADQLWNEVQRSLSYWQQYHP